MKPNDDSPLIEALSRCGIRPEDRLLVGVSGGMDSLYLLLHLSALGQSVTAAVFDHRLREKSAEEADFVEVFCRERGIPCLRGSGEVREYSQTHKCSLEDAARQRRYCFLFDCAEQCGAAAVATAHHADDQAETVLLHLLRGCGLDGLCGMQARTLLPEFSATIPLVRPLLAAGVRRGEIEAFFAENGLPHAEDESNSDTAMLRNRIRHELLPELTARYNPRVTESLLRLSESVSVDRAMLDAITENALCRCRFVAEGKTVSLDRDAFTREAEGMQTRILRRAVAATGVPMTEFGLETWQRMAAFFRRAPLNAELRGQNRLTLVCEGPLLRIMPEDEAPRTADYPQISKIIMIPLRNNIYEFESFSLRVTTINGELAVWINRVRKNRCLALFDADKLTGQLCLRQAYSGERFVPLGMTGSMKISDYLINQKIPRPYRAAWPLLADAEGPLWLLTLRTAERVRVTEKTTSAVLTEVISQR